MTDRIDLTLYVADPQLREALQTHGVVIASEAMAINWSVLSATGGEHQEDIDGKTVGLDLIVSA